MRFGSVCSGVEAASVAFAPSGWQAAWLSELDIAASQVLAHRLGATCPLFGLDEKAQKRAKSLKWGDRLTNWGDMTVLPEKVRSGEAEAPDILCGGTPCQSYSLAGRRQGLADKRGQLTLTFVELADAIDDTRAMEGKEPCIVFWENVPGVLTSKDNAFGNYLADLAGCDEPIEPGPRPEQGRSSAHWTWQKKTGVHVPKWPRAGVIVGPRRTVAWRTPDAQYFGLAQRRSRVLVVASAGERVDPATVLLEFDGLRRDSEPSREAREEAAHAVAPSLVASGAGVERVGDRRGQDPVIGCFVDVAPQDGCRNGGGAQPGDPCQGLAAPGGAGQVSREVAPQWWDGRPVSQTLDAVLHKGQTMPEKDRFPAVLHPVPILEAGARTGRAGHEGRDGMGIGKPGDPMFTLQAKAQHAVAVLDPIPFNWAADGKQTDLGFNPGAKVCGTLGANQHPAFLQTLAFDTTQVTNPDNGANPQWNNPCHSLAAGAHPPAICVTGDITHTLTGEGFDASEDGTGRGTPITLDRQPDRTHPCGEVAYRMMVRRLMPVEAERLQGFPDNWTLVPVGKKSAADGPRYKQMGNSWPVNMIHFFGDRIDKQMRATPSLPPPDLITLTPKDYAWLTAP